MVKVFILEKDFTRKIVTVEGDFVTIKTEDIWVRGIINQKERFTDTYTNVLNALIRDGFDLVDIG